MSVFLKEEQGGDIVPRGVSFFFEKLLPEGLD
jgi:hypothetical protein